MSLRCLKLGSSVGERGGDERYVPIRSRFALRAHRMRALLLSFVEACDESGVETPGDKFFVAHDLAKEGQRRLNAAHCVFVQRPPQSIDSLCARASPHGKRSE